VQAHAHERRRALGDLDAPVAVAKVAEAEVERRRVGARPRLEQPRQVRDDELRAAVEEQHL